MKNRLKVGNKYKENVMLLTELIAKHEVEVREEFARNQSCYFCNQPIQGKKYVIKYGNENYSLHTSCYEKASK